MSTVPKGSVYCFKFKIWFYLVHLQQLKGMQSSKQGIRKGAPFFNRRYLFREKWYVKAGKGNRVGPRGGASLYKSLLSAPRFCNTYSKHFTIFITNCIIYTGTGKLKTYLGLPSSSETKSKPRTPYQTFFSLWHWVQNIYSLYASRTETKFNIQKFKIAIQFSAYQ